jgi:alkanesulfonate monooxygenase SsuD/methylene tetrahydromethanopterin reductase-like flavin-dependent oxidoreductase (luciferase family)
MTMDFSIWPNPSRSFGDTLAAARWAEQRGLHGMWFADHLAAYSEDGSCPDEPMHECWSTLAAVGALVPSLTLTSMVSPTTLHHPVALLKRAVEVDHISGGRAVLGLGAGWQLNEHVGYGFPLPAPRDRVDRFAEFLEVLRLLRGEDRTHFQGTWFHLDGAVLSPKPEGKLPIVIGTTGPRMLRLTSRYADGWNMWGTPDRVEELTRQFERICAIEKRDPSRFRRSAQALIFHTESRRDRERIEAEYPGRVITGSAAEIVEQLARYAELGVHEFGINDTFFGTHLEERLERLDDLAENVLVHC